MKKIKIITLLVSICLIVVMVACSTPAQAPAPSPAAAPAPAQTPAQPKVLKLKLQTNVIPVETEKNVGQFPVVLKEMTGGRIEVELFSIGTLVPIQEQFDAIAEGALDMGWSSEGYYSGKVPVSEVASGLPYSLTSIYEGQDFWYEHGMYELLRDEYAKQGVHYLTAGGSSTGMMTNKPINKASDFQGMKIRGWGAMAEWLTKLGAKCVNIPGGELYTALATGVVDGAHWGPAGPMFDMKFQEVLKYIMEPDPIGFQAKSFYVNMDLWNSLSAEDQAIMTNAVHVAQDFNNVRRVSVENKRALQKMVNDFGVTIVRPSEEEMAIMRQAAMEVWDDIAKKNPMNEKAVNMLKDYLRGLGYLK